MSYVCYIEVLNAFEIILEVINILHFVFELSNYSFLFDFIWQEYTELVIIK